MSPRGQAVVAAAGGGGYRSGGKSSDGGAAGGGRQRAAGAGRGSAGTKRDGSGGDSTSGSPAPPAPQRQDLDFSDEELVLPQQAEPPVQPQSQRRAPSSRGFIGRPPEQAQARETDSDRLLRKLTAAPAAAEEASRSPPKPNPASGSVVRGLPGEGGGAAGASRARTAGSRREQEQQPDDSRRAGEDSSSGSASRRGGGQRSGAAAAGLGGDQQDLQDDDYDDDDGYGDQLLGWTPPAPDAADGVAAAASFPSSSFISSSRLDEADDDEEEEEEGDDAAADEPDAVDPEFVAAGGGGDDDEEEELLEDDDALDVLIDGLLGEAGELPEEEGEGGAAGVDEAGRAPRGKGAAPASQDRPGDRPGSARGLRPDSRVRAGMAMVIPDAGDDDGDRAVFDLSLVSLAALDDESGASGDDAFGASGAATPAAAAAAATSSAAVGPSGTYATLATRIAECSATVQLAQLLAPQLDRLHVTSLIAALERLAQLTAGARSKREAAVSAKAAQSNAGSSRRAQQPSAGFSAAEAEESFSAAAQRQQQEEGEGEELLERVVATLVEQAAREADVMTSAEAATALRSVVQLGRTSAVLLDGLLGQIGRYPSHQYQPRDMAAVLWAVGALFNADAVAEQAARKAESEASVMETIETLQAASAAGTAAGATTNALGAAQAIMTPALAAKAVVILNQFLDHYGGSSFRLASFGPLELTNCMLGLGQALPGLAQLEPPPLSGGAAAAGGEAAAAMSDVGLGGSKLRSPGAFLGHVCKRLAEGGLLQRLRSRDIETLAWTCVAIQTAAQQMGMAGVVPRALPLALVQESVTRAAGVQRAVQGALSSPPAMPPGTAAPVSGIFPWQPPGIDAMFSTAPYGRPELPQLDGRTRTALAVLSSPGESAVSVKAMATVLWAAGELGCPQPAGCAAALQTFGDVLPGGLSLLELSRLLLGFGRAGYRPSHFLARLQPWLTELLTSHILRLSPTTITNFAYALALMEQQRGGSVGATTAGRGLGGASMPSSSSPGGAAFTVTPALLDALWNNSLWRAGEYTFLVRRCLTSFITAPLVSPASHDRLGLLALT